MKKSVFALSILFLLGFVSLSAAVDYLKFYKRISSIGVDSANETSEAVQTKEKIASKSEEDSKIEEDLSLTRVEIEFKAEGTFREVQKKLQSELGVFLSPPLETSELHVSVKGYTVDEIVEKVCRLYDVNCTKVDGRHWKVSLTESQVFFIDSDFEGKRSQKIVSRIKELLSDRGRAIVLDRSRVYVEDTPLNMERIRRLFALLNSEDLYCFNVKLIEVAYRSKSGSSFGWGSIISTMGAKVLVGTATGLPTPGMAFAIGSDSFLMFMTLLKRKGQARVVKEWSLSGPVERPLFFRDGTIVDVGQEVTTASGSSVVKTRRFRDVGFEIQILPHVKRDGLLTADIKVRISQLGPRVKVQKVESVAVLEREFQTKTPLELGKPVVVIGFKGAAHTSRNKGVPKLQDLKYVSTAFAKKGRSDLEVEYALVIEAKKIRLRHAGSEQKEEDFLFSAEVTSK